MKPSILRATLASAFCSACLVAAEPEPVDPSAVNATETAEVETNAPPPLVADTNAPPARVIQPARIILPAPLAEVVRLAEAGMSDEVILSYIQKSPAIEPLTADQLLYLRDLGISSKLLAALIEYRPAVPAQGEEPVPAPTVPQYPPATPEMAGVTDMPPAAPAVVEENYFYSSLAPYGSWLDLPGYGWCWRPTVAAVRSSWRPYCDSGYWAWSDCGWYWNSYYSWGWAPFHYGRWCQYPRYGWIWCPDRTWGPAWVCWRQSGKHCGWAPLPPGSHFHGNKGWTFRGTAVGTDFGFGLPAASFTFVSVDHIGDRHSSNHRLQGQEAQAAFAQTRVNNNFVAGANNRIINRGIDPLRVQAVTRQPIRPVAVADLEKARRSTAVNLPMVARRNPAPAVPVAARIQPAVRTPSTGNAVVQSPRGTGLASRPAFSSPAPAYTRPAQRAAPQIAIPRYNAPQVRVPAAGQMNAPQSRAPGAGRMAPQQPIIQRQAPAVSVPQSQPARPGVSTPRSIGMESMHTGPR